MSTKKEPQKDGRQKTVKVQSYIKQDGTYVPSHKRRPPKE